MKKNGRVLVGRCQGTAAAAGDGDLGEDGTGAGRSREAEGHFWTVE